MSEKKFKVVIKSEFCKGCELCIGFCKKEVIRTSDAYNAQGYHYAEPVDGKECTGCMSCTLVCPEVAVEVYYE